MADPASALDQLWAQGERPDLSAFLAHAGSLSPTRLAEVIRVDQRQRWQAGMPISAEIYLEQFPQIKSNAELAIDLIFNEFLVRDDLDEKPDPDEYLRRFPEHAAVLQDQFALHRALATRQISSNATVHVKNAAHLPPADLPERFGRYRIIKRLGQGGMGTVYLAEDTLLKRQVALKVPRLAGDDRSLMIERFYREARIAGTFRHPNLCTVFDVGEIDGVHFLTMPLLAGESLSALLKRSGPLPEADASCLALHVARAVHVAHQAGVVHRDLKPSNIMIGTDGAPIVMDFGLALSSKAPDPRLTSTGEIVGTGAYAAPEQIRADAEIGPACDVYGLGVVLFEMLTGRVPFQGKMHEVLQGVLSSETPSPRQFRPEIALKLEAICLKALAKEPDDRYRSMAEFAMALEQLGDSTTNAEADTALFGPQRVAKCSTWSKRLGLMAVLAAVILGVLLWIALREKTETPPADLLPTSSAWNGEFDFPDLKYTGDVAIWITERNGERFRGIYHTERGDYQWRIEGTLRGNAIQWEFTEVIAERETRQVVGHARVEGTMTAEEMTVTFYHRVYKSTAYMTLRREK